MEAFDGTSEPAHEDMYPTGTGEPAHEDMYPTGYGESDLGGVAGADDHTAEPTISVVIDGDPIEAHATIDSNHDGRPDTAVVDLGGGYHAEVTDSTGDGQADEAVLLDPSGHVIDHQHVDPSGNWVDDGASGGAPDASTASTQPDGTPSTGGDTPGAGRSGDDTVTLTYQGHAFQAVATVDVNGDGKPDSGYITDPHTGYRYLITDFDGDGRADHVVIYDAQGNEVGGAGIAADNAWIPDGDASRTAYVVDPKTGQWVAESG